MINISEQKKFSLEDLIAKKIQMNLVGMTWANTNLVRTWSNMGGYK